MAYFYIILLMKYKTFLRHTAHKTYSIKKNCTALSVYVK